MLLYAFIGGLILNIMPCVLPVIAFKILGFVSESKSSPQRVRALGGIYAIGVLFSFLVLPGLAAPAVPADQNLDRVLRRLDAAAVNFRSTSADFEFDSVVTDPVEDKEVQKGAVYYERKGSVFQMAAHIREVNGKPVPKIFAYSGGSLRLYEQLTNQVTTSSATTAIAHAVVVPR